MSYELHFDEKVIEFIQTLDLNLRERIFKKLASSKTDPLQRYFYKLSNYKSNRWFFMKEKFAKSKEVVFPINIYKEKVKAKVRYTAVCPINDVASQGDTSEMALERVKEALELYYEDKEMAKDILKMPKAIMSNVPITIPIKVC